MGSRPRSPQRRPLRARGSSSSRRPATTRRGMRCCLRWRGTASATWRRCVTRRASRPSGRERTSPPTLLSTTRPSHHGRRRARRVRHDRRRGRGARRPPPGPRRCRRLPGASLSDRFRRARRRASVVGAAGRSRLGGRLGGRPAGGGARAGGRRPAPASPPMPSWSRRGPTTRRESGRASGDMPPPCRAATMPPLPTAT